MIIYPSTLPGPLVLNDRVSRSAKLPLMFLLRPLPWQANMDVYKSQVLAPTTNNGAMYVASQPGRTGDTEPAWTTDPDEEVADNTVVYIPRPYNALLPPTATLTDVTFDGVNCDIDSDQFDDYTASCRFLNITADTTIDHICIIPTISWTTLEGFEAQDDKAITIYLKDSGC